MSRRVKDWIDGWLEFRDNTEPPVIYNLWTAFLFSQRHLNERSLFIGSTNYTQTSTLY